MLNHNLQHFLQYLTLERGLASNSISAYRTDLEDLNRALQERNIHRYSDVSRNLLLDYLGECRENGLESTTIARRLVAIRLLFRFLYNEGLLQQNVTEVMDSPKLWMLLPDFLSESEVTALLRAFSMHSENPLEVRNRTILEVLYSSGLRVSEVASLPLDAVDYDTEMVRVTGKGQKTRLIPIGKPALRALRFYLAEIRPLLAEKNPRAVPIFLSHTGKRLDRERIWGIVKEAALLAGIQKNVHPHTLRHSFASHLLANGADLRVIQEMLGHSDIGTTEIYTHVDQDRLTSIHRKFHPRG